MLTYNFTVQYFIRGLKQPIMEQYLDVYPSFISKGLVFSYEGKDYSIRNWGQSITKKGMHISVELGLYEARLSDNSSNGVY